MPSQAVSSQTVRSSKVAKSWSSQSRRPQLIFQITAACERSRTNSVNHLAERLSPIWVSASQCHTSREDGRCAEYSVARRDGTIINLSDESVKSLEKACEWPNTVHEDADMMDKNVFKPVSFTKKGDREAVRYIFYKITYVFAGRVGETDVRA